MNTTLKKLIKNQTSTTKKATSKSIKEKKSFEIIPNSNSIYLLNKKHTSNT